MTLLLEAACGCHIGKVRKNNEDNFFFDGRCLELENKGLRHPVLLERELHGEEFFAVFDGMGGEQFGEVASFTAANCVKESRRRLKDFFIPESSFLTELCTRMNEEVLKEQQKYCDDRMGTTMVGLLFAHRKVYVCNLGDSRAYRLRDGVFSQISVDHVESHYGQHTKKLLLTQHLGIDPEEFIIEPYIAKGDLKPEDQYLICSDGLTDMLSNLEIVEIMKAASTAEDCICGLIQAALDNGGRDNMTAIICKLK